ncbi:MAG: response regulator [Candidatus Heimdallarchaeota archaeon]|nr:response regulator [Candidatus Heimdallarchaeota archaeon]MBY8995013.1 response regulator [Candidatus Heimdallarchaeota archaeon]
MNEDTKNLKIMIVEDDPLIRQLYEQILSQKGYHVICVASDGAEAVKLYHKLDEKPDLIILDFRMPKKNGLEVSQEILGNNSSTDILMISGDPLIDRKAVISSRVNVMQKPVNINALLQEIRTIGGY